MEADVKLEDYQKAAFFTARPDTETREWIVGLIGEFGEVAEAIKKKYLRQNPNISEMDIADEVGDLLWYICAIHTSMNEWVQFVPGTYNTSVFDVVDWVLTTGQRVGLVAELFSNWSQKGHAQPFDIRMKLESIISACIGLLAWLGVDLDTVLERNLAKLREKYSGGGYVSDAKRLSAENTELSGDLSE